MDAPSWNGWGAGYSNARFQDAEHAGLSPAQVPKLRLKWAFGLPQGADSFSQPTVAAGRVFVGSDNGFVYAVDAGSGCVYWSFRADSAIRSAPVFVRAAAGASPPFMLLFGDVQKRVYALDAQSGRQLWKTRVDDQFRSHMTASPAYFDGKLFVPISGTETLVGGKENYECCSMRGAVVAVDAATGKILWRTETIAEKATPRGRNQAGVQLWGPAGASVWNTPTIDARRRLVYVGTGNGYTAPAAPTTDSILALSVDTGQIMWHHQEFSGDAFIGGCAKTNAAGGNCPEKLGPDWDFGGASVVLQKLPDGRDILVAAGKGGVAVALDPDRKGEVLWRTTLYDGDPPSAGGLVVFGATADGQRIYYPLNQPGGGIAAVDVRDGKRLWTRTGITTDKRGQSAAASSIPGVVFTGAWDGTLRAYSSRGDLLWSFDTAREFPTVNGVAAKGGSLGQPGATIAGGMLFIGSGYVGTQSGMPGNVILAFAPE